jgi:hypothetical protein
VTQAITVMNYMGYVPWAQHSWFPQLWPGNDVVDWIGIDPYGSGDATGYLSGDLATLINRKGTSFPGFYTWATTQHPDKPLMVVEWGVGESTTNPTGKAAYFRSVASEIDSFPAVRGMMYYDSDNCPDPGYRDTRPDSTATSLAAFKTLSADPRFSVGAFHYSGTGVVSGP